MRLMPLSMVQIGVLKQYLFDLVIENYIKEDYVTCKVYQALYAGAIPVYLGAPNVEQVLPCDNCIINAANFNSTAHLVTHLQNIVRSTALQRHYHAWRHQEYKPDDYPGFERARSLSIDTLHCRICHVASPHRCSKTCGEACHSTAIRA